MPPPLLFSMFLRHSICLYASYRLLTKTEAIVKYGDPMSAKFCTKFSTIYVTLILKKKMVDISPERYVI